MTTSAAESKNGASGQVLERLGRYDLIHRIGAGGMAEVFLARQRGPMGFEKLVVVKKIHEELSRQPSFIEMLLKEARISALLKHPNIVDIYDLGHEGRTYFIAMEYLAGQPLTKLITTGVRKKHPLPIEAAVRVIADAAAGLDAAHNLKSMTGEPIELIHRDVSPGNIVVLYEGGVKLVDFGIAKAEGEVTAAGGPRMLKGKAGYVSPELIETGSIDRRSDIFSLGIVLWETLTLRRLYRAEDDAATLEMIKAGDPMVPSRYRREIPEELDRICLRALATNPDDRYQDAKEIRTDLENFLWKTSGNDRRVDPLAVYMKEMFADQASEDQRMVRRAIAPELDAAEEKTEDDANKPEDAEAKPDDVKAKSGGDAEAKPDKEGLARRLPLPPPSLGNATPALGKRARRISTQGSSVRAPTPTPLPPEPDIEIVPEQDNSDTVVDTSPGAFRHLMEAQAELGNAPAVEPAAPEPAEATADDPIAIIEEEPAPSRRGLIIGGALGGTILLIVVLAIVLRTGDKAKPTPQAKNIDDNPPTTEPAQTEPATDPPAPAPVAAIATDAAAAPQPQPAIDGTDAGTAAEQESDGIDAGTAVEPTDTNPPAKSDEDTHEPAHAHTAHKSPAKPKPRTQSRPSKPKPDPKKAAALYQQGFQAFVRGDLSTAQKQFIAATRADPGYARAYRGLGFVYDKKHEKSRAIHALEKYLRLAPKAPDAASIRQRLTRLGG